jgi:hypothetical protein
VAPTKVLDVDLFDPALYRNGMPHELCAELRDTGPVLWRAGTAALARASRTELQVMIGAMLRRFAVIEITSDRVWMSAGPAVAVGVAVQSLPVRLA